MSDTPGGVVPDTQEFPPSRDCSEVAGAPLRGSGPTARHFEVPTHRIISTAPEPLGRLTGDHVFPPSVVLTAIPLAVGFVCVSGFGPTATHVVEDSHVTERKELEINVVEESSMDDLGLEVGRALADSEGSLGDR